MTALDQHHPAPRLRVVVVGGGTAGWMTAAALVRLLPTRFAPFISLNQRQSASSASVKPTIPHIRAFNERLAIDEADFMAATRATYKLGIEFTDWRGSATGICIRSAGSARTSVVLDSSISGTGRDCRVWEAGDFGDYAIAVAMSRRSRFASPSNNIPGSHPRTATPISLTPASLHVICGATRRTSA